ncbi:MAG: 50S ribosomal protein L16 [Candidatus Diapherotrites archaeon]|uniref:50S ribosomal protein L16 n=1 Tax=Candidatus Iainarchaeum sp. TaxID=3101447 RepID=A0A2D6M1B5_9ARCH|nr:50S ribosomal protein L16 [Candidatus Diapherotrites archaeon]
MGLRPGRCYRTKKDRAYSRTAVRVHRRNYIGAVPGLRTRQFNMGNPAKNFTHILDLVSNEHVQVRDNSIESARIAINRYLTNHVGKDGYFMKIRIYPFQILRENKQAQGAHADRIQTGMSKAFGKPIGRAARVRPGQKLISVLIDEANVTIAKEALLRAKSRLTCNISVKIGTDIESIGTKPKRVKEVKIEEKPKEEEKVEGKEGEEKATEEGKEEVTEDKGKKEEAKGEEKKK